MTQFPKQKIYKSKAYLAHVRSFPCCACGRSDTECHHIRFSFNSGVGMKPSDCWSIPLCPACHREYHDHGPVSFKKKYDVDIWRELFLIAKSWIEKKAAKERK